jgi:hypothetical protein
MFPCDGAFDRSCEQFGLGFLEVYFRIVVSDIWYEEGGIGSMIMDFLINRVHVSIVNVAPWNVFQICVWSDWTVPVSLMCFGCSRICFVSR